MPSSDLARILQLEVPLIVQLGERGMSVHEAISMTPGTILELPKPADSELELLVNNKVIGSGMAVKVGEKFGIRISFLGDIRERIAALGRLGQAETGEPEPVADADEAASLAEALLADGG